jgi:SOS-response transcriptional repressor LexA
MTPEQRDCLQVISEMFDADGIAPSQREIARELDLSVGSVQHLVGALVERGWLGREPHRHRGLRILHRPPMPDFRPPQIQTLGIPF